MFLDSFLFAGSNMSGPGVLGMWGVVCWDEGLDFIWDDGEALAESVDRGVV